MPTCDEIHSPVPPEPRRDLRDRLAALTPRELAMVESLAHSAGIEPQDDEGLDATPSGAQATLRAMATMLDYYAQQLESAGIIRDWVDPNCGAVATGTGYILRMAAIQCRELARNVKEFGDARD